MAATTERCIVYMMTSGLQLTFTSGRGQRQTQCHRTGRLGKWRPAQADAPCTFKEAVEKLKAEALEELRDTEMTEADMALFERHIKWLNRFRNR